MRLPDVIGVLGALVVGGLLTVLLLANAIGGPPALVTPSPPTMPPLPSFVAVATPTALASVPATPEGSGSPTVGVGIGQVAPTIEVTLTDGSLFSTADYPGQPLWINFMATWCPQCIDELPMMETYQAQLEGQMMILVIDVGEDRHTVNAFVHSLNFDLPVGVDSDSSIQRAWGAFALPIHYWTDTSGVIQQIVFGGAPQAIFDQAIGAVLPAPSPTPSPAPVSSP
jgi:thiol-disulfide isomerase/thioredoxin